MDIFNILFISIDILLLVLILFLLRYVAVKWFRPIAIIFFLGFISCSWFAYTELLSRAKPVEYEWLRSYEKILVMNFYPIENVGIWLWVKLPNEDDPRNYRIAWNLELAKELEKKMAEAKNQNQPGVYLENPFENGQMKHWFEPSFERNPLKVHPIPQPSLPPKMEENTPEPNKPKQYKHPSQDA